MTSVGSGKVSAGSVNGFSFVRQRVAGGGHRELRDRADLAGLQLPGRLLLLAVEQQQLADALVGVLGRVPGVALRMERAGETRT